MAGSPQEPLISPAELPPPPPNAAELWTRGERMTGDWWQCDTCDTMGWRDGGDDQPAIEHVRRYGHAVSVHHHSSQMINPVRTT